MMFIKALAFACLAATSVAAGTVRGDNPSIERRLDDILDPCIMCAICDAGGDLCDLGTIGDFICSICDDDDDDDDEDDIGVCFSELATVQVFQQGAVPMKDLKVGDRVLTAKNEYETVYAFAHNNPTRASKFFQIHSDHSKRALEITADHMVYVQGQEAPVAAAKIQVGDTLRSSQGESKVTKISTVVRKGLYAPLTPSGTVVVDGVTASSYISLGSQRALSDHTLIHMTLSPYRMVCSRVSAHFCNTESYNDDGMPHFVEYGLRFLHWLNNCGAIVQAVVFAILMACSATSCAVELLFAVPALACVAVVAYTSHQKNNQANAKVL